MWSFVFKVCMWVAVAVTVILVAVAVSVGLALFVPVLAVWAAWEWFVGRHKDALEVEHQKLLAEAKAHG